MEPKHSGARPGDNDARRCQARSKQSGERCRRWACKGRRVCAMHGGRTPRGAASPHLVHGRHSKDLPSHLSERYAGMLEDPERAGLRSEIALVNVAITDRLERLPEAVETEEEKREDARLWRQMGTLFLTKARLISDQVQHEQRARQTLTAEQGVALVSASVRRHVRDRQPLAAISREMEEMIERIERVRE